MDNSSGTVLTSKRGLSGPKPSTTVVEGPNLAEMNGVLEINNARTCATYTFQCYNIIIKKTEKMLLDFNVG